METKQRFISPEEVSELLSIPRRTVLKMIREGRLEAFNFSGKLRIDASGLDRMIESSKVNGNG